MTHPIRGHHANNPWEEARKRARKVRDAARAALQSAQLASDEAFETFCDSFTDANLQRLEDSLAVLAKRQEAFMHADSECRSIEGGGDLAGVA